MKRLKLFGVLILLLFISFSMTGVTAVKPFEKGIVKKGEAVSIEYIGYKYNEKLYRLILKILIKDFPGKQKYIDLKVKYNETKKQIIIWGYDYVSNEKIYKLIKNIKKNQAKKYYNKYKDYYIKKY